MMLGFGAAGSLLLSTIDLTGSLTGLWIIAGVVAAGIAFASLPQVFAPLVAPVRDLRPSERSQFDLPPGEPVKVLAVDGLVNAFAAGVFPGFRVVFVTTGLLRNLSAAEVQAIVAHERGHLHRGHVGLRVGSVVLIVAPWLFATVTGVPGGFHAGLLALGPATLFVCWLGRWTEYDADAYAARRVDGDTLSSALERVHPHTRPAREPNRLMALFSTHPPVDRRLAKLSGRVGEASEVIRDDNASSVRPAPVSGLAGGVLTAWAKRPAFPGSRSARSIWEIVFDALGQAVQVVHTASIRWSGRVVYETSTPYQSLLVVDRGSVRWLFLDGYPHSTMDLDHPHKHVFDYTRYFHLPFLFHREVENVLFIGGGGFTGPKRFLADYNVTVDVIEHDPDVVNTAQRFFDVEPSNRLTVHVGDGRQFLRETTRTYDVIILDAFESGEPPSRLTTVEFLQLTHDRLSSDGVLLANLVSAPKGPLSGFYRAECETITSVFPRVYSFPTDGGFLPQNIEVVATMDEERVTPADLRRRNEQGDAGIDLSRELDAYQQVSSANGGRGLLNDDQLEHRS